MFFWCSAALWEIVLSWDGLTASSRVCVLVSRHVFLEALKTLLLWPWYVWVTDVKAGLGKLSCKRTVLQPYGSQLSWALCLSLSLFLSFMDCFLCSPNQLILQNRTCQSNSLTLCPLRVCAAVMSYFPHGRNFCKNDILQTSKHHFQRLVVCVCTVHRYDHVDCVWLTLIWAIMTNWIVLTGRCAAFCLL